MTPPAAGSLAPWFNASGRKLGRAYAAERLMRRGYGYEDVAVALKLAADDVRAYAAWLDAQGLLRWLYTGRAA